MKQQLMMLLLGTASVFCSCETQVEQHEKNELRAPAYPLVTIDPYTSAWSTTDNLYDSPVKHWTGKDFSLLGVAKVDGQTYRFMGTEELELRPLVKTSEQGSWTGKYTTQQPADGCGPVSTIRWITPLSFWRRLRPRNSRLKKRPNSKASN